MAKEKPTWTAYTVIAVIATVVGLISGQSDRIFGKGQNLGIMRSDIDANTKDIATLKKDGCDPSSQMEAILVRLDRIEKNEDRVEAQSKEMDAKQEAHLNRLEAKIDKIIEVIYTGN